MSSDADKYWHDIAGKLRKKKGLSPLTPQEAEAAFDAAPEIPLSDDHIRSIVESVKSGELTTWEPLPNLDWTDELDLQTVEDGVGQLFRNEGKHDPETDKAEEELREELLGDDESKDDPDGMDGGAAPAGDGR